MHETTERFDTWALVEIMGHKQIAGRVSETTLAGAGMLRVDVPAVPGEPGVPGRSAGHSGMPGFTKLLSPSAIYAITPVEESVARQLAASLRERPVEIWRLDASRALPPARRAEIEDDDEDMEDVPRCRVCGCTDEHACPGGCSWVEDPEGGDLCSACAERMKNCPIENCPEDATGCPCHLVLGPAAEDKPPAQADEVQHIIDDLKECHYPGGEPVIPQIAQQPAVPPQLLPVCDTCADEAGCERRRTAAGPIFECHDYSMPF